MGRRAQSRTMEKVRENRPLYANGTKKNNRYVNEEKSARMAHHGTTEDDGESIHGIGGVRTREDGITEPVTDPEKEKALDSESSSDKELPINEASGVRVDAEKGRDLNVIDWWGPTDSEVRLQYENQSSMIMY